MPMPIHIKLRSIPPANRQPETLARVASFGKPARIQEDQTVHKPHIIAPDHDVQRCRRIFHQTVQHHIERLENLIEAAAAPEEAAFWTEILERLRKGC